MRRPPRNEIAPVGTAEIAPQIFRFLFMQLHRQPAGTRMLEQIIDQVWQIRRLVDPTRYMVLMRLMKERLSDPSRIQLSKNGLASPQIQFRSSCRPKPSILSRVFCSSISRGCTSMLEAAGGLEQRQQKNAEGNILSGRSKIGSDTVRWPTEFVYPGFRRHPAGFDMQSATRR